MRSPARARRRPETVKRVPSIPWVSAAPATMRWDWGTVTETETAMP